MTWEVFQYLCTLEEASSQIWNWCSKDWKMPWNLYHSQDVRNRVGPWAIKEDQIWEIQVEEELCSWNSLEFWWQSAATGAGAAGIVCSGIFKRGEGQPSSHLSNNHEKTYSNLNTNTNTLVLKLCRVTESPTNRVKWRPTSVAKKIWYKKRREGGVATSSSALPNAPQSLSQLDTNTTSSSLTNTIKNENKNTYLSCICLVKREVVTSSYSLSNALQSLSQLDTKITSEITVSLSRRHCK